MINHLVLFFFFSLLFKSIRAEYRTLNGTYNNLNNPILPKEFSRLNPPVSYYSAMNLNSSVIVPAPGFYALQVPADFVNCSASINIPDGLHPLPRCVSDLVGSIRTNTDDVYNLNNLEKFKSKRKISHIATFFGFFMVTDLVSGDHLGDSYPNGIYIPQDDQLYLSRYYQSPDLSMNTSALPFNRSTPTPGSTGSNQNTPFVDGSQLYGLSIERLQQIRDYGNHGRMFLYSYSNDATDDSSFGYPPKDAYGEYIFGDIPRKGRNIFTDMFNVVFLREHNRRCDQLWNIYNDTWTDEVYFQECRKWVIGLLQHVAFYEYLGIVLGSPLPLYKGYDQTLVPSIDTFFGTVTYRYGHSEVSDYYNIVNSEGNVLATLPLNSLQRPHLLETYGVPVIALSLSLQRQEEIDIYFADMMRKFIVQYQNQTSEMDIASTDVVRSRDRVIPLYNDARASMGLSRAKRWSDITSDPEVQQRLIDTYKSVDKVESFFGGLAEDHTNGSDFGELFYKSFYDQWMSIRNSDRFWYEAPDAGFTQEEIAEINNTTLSQIIARNTPTTYQLPSNLWIVQPSTSITTVSNDINNPLISTNYPPLNHVKLSENFEVFWRIADGKIYFKLNAAITNGWFAIGFNDKDSMITSDMVICKNTNDSVDVRQYTSDGYITPNLVEQNQLIKVVRTDFKEGLYSTAEFSRPLIADGSMLKPIKENKLITMIYAWNPSNNIITYHAGNRGSMEIDFFSYATVSDVREQRRKNLLSHGIAMFLVFAILYPISIWRVRYRKTKGSYIKKHRNFQLLGAFLVAIFGGIALAISGEYFVKTTTIHGTIGLSIICAMGAQVVLGFSNMWSLINVESVNMGIMKVLRYFHRILGIMIILLSLADIDLGMREYRGQFGSNKYWSIVYLVWVGILILLFIISENIFRVRNMSFRYSRFKNDRDISRPKQKLRNLIEDYDQLPTLSLEEFNDRVIRGMKLIVVENMIFDLGKWIEYHPGGAKILQRVIGTDVTNDFFGVDSILEDNVDKDKPYELNIPDYEKDKKDQNISKAFKGAHFIDIININKILGKRSARVSVHNHSRYATEKLATMVIAKLSDENEKVTSDSALVKRRYTSCRYNQPAPQTDFSNIPSKSIFNRCIITNIEIVTDNLQSNSPIVKKFTLKPIVDFHYRKFLPGDYIEIMCDIDQQRITRHYCPLSQEFSEDYQEHTSKKIEINKTKKETFWILVKIYEGGFMSKYLNKQLKNFEILVRGPFNLSDDLINNQTLSISNCVLLNPNNPNGCWNNLFMICGGTGITPMLQLIHFHLREYQKILNRQLSSLDTFNLHLLFANNSASEIIYQSHLDYLVRKFVGNLTITHILVNPPDNWNGLKGYIDDVILFDWLYNNINIDTLHETGIEPETSTTNVGPTQIVYYPQQHHYTGSSFDDYNTPLVIPHSEDQQRSRTYSTSSQDPLMETSSSSHSTRSVSITQSANIINNFPDDSKVVVCGSDNFMISIQHIINRIGIKEKDILFLI